MNQHTPPALKSESDLERAGVDLAKLYGILSYKFVSPGCKGVPDRLFIFQGGETIYVEFKHPDGSGRLSSRQKRRIKEIRDNGAAAYECDTFEGFRAIVERHTSRNWFRRLADRYLAKAKAALRGGD